MSETSAAASSQSKTSSVLPGQSENDDPGVGSAPVQVREQQVLTHQVPCLFHAANSVFFVFLLLSIG